MSKKFMKVLLLTILLLNISITTAVNLPTNNFEAEANSTVKVHIEPANATADVGEYYTISVKVDNVTDLYGFGIKFRWGAAVLKYVSHTVTVPVETYPDGVLHKPVFKVKDEVDETAGIGTCEVAASSIGESSFNGSGTILNMTFQVLRTGECDIYFVSTDLSDPHGTPIEHDVEDGYFYIPELGNVPIANFTFSPDPAIENKPAIFDASESYDPDPDGGIALYIWNFGDGTVENTTDTIITHNYTALGIYTASLTVLDDQPAEGGSQSKPKHLDVKVVSPAPVAKFDFWPDVAVINRNVTFDASASYDPDPDGGIALYIWNFGDGTVENTTDTIITHNYTKTKVYKVTLKVMDIEGLCSDIYWDNIEVVERRDIEVTNVTVYPSELMRGFNATIEFTTANKGFADESFNVTAYYNRTEVDWTNITATEWVKIEQLTRENISKQSEPEWKLTDASSTYNPTNWVLNKWEPGAEPQNEFTRVRVGNNTGYWTINPGKLNEADSTATLVSGTPLTTGGWIWEEIIYGDFSAGNWSFTVRLYSTHENVNVTIWVRILKSKSPNPQAEGAQVTVLKDWKPLFSAKPLLTSVQLFSGNVSVDAATFANEYLYVEFQLEVTENEAGNDTEVVFQIGADKGSEKPKITAATFSYKKSYVIYWDTGDVIPGDYWIMVKTSEVPHETNITNNLKLSSDFVHLKLAIPVAKFVNSPIVPIVNETVIFDASESYHMDPNGTITCYVWNFGDGTVENTTNPIIPHNYIDPGVYKVNLTVADNFNQTDFATKYIEVKAYYPLEVTIKVGTIHFPGEKAEFYILTLRSGERFDISEIKALLILNGEIFENLTDNVKPVVTGLYLISYEIPLNASAGEYLLLVDASYYVEEANLSLKGTAQESFSISSTLTGWNALLVKIDDDIGTIKTNVGYITLNLTTINATLSGLIVDAEGEILARIDTALGSVITKLDNIGGTVTEINGNTVTINTSLGDLQTSVGGLQSTLTIGIAAASILSAIAAIAAIIILLRIKKLSK